MIGVMVDRIKVPVTGTLLVVVISIALVDIVIFLILFFFPFFIP
jgi:hypothetical protein